MLNQEYDVIVCPAFGTKNPEEFNKTYGAICRHISVAADMPVYIRITSEFIYKKLSGELSDIHPFSGVFDSILESGVKRVLVIPVLMADGNEYRKIRTLCYSVRGRFEKLTLFGPLMLQKNIRLAEFIDRNFEAEDGKKYVFVGHGSDGENTEYTQLELFLRNAGREDVSIKLIHSHDADPMTADFENDNKDICFVPLMISAGHHIQETFESIESQYSQKSVKLSFVREGLGEYKEFQELFL